MSQISSKLKLIAAVAVGAAMLSACGSKQQATPNTHSTTISQDNQNSNNSSNTGNSNNNGGNTSNTNNGNANNNNTGNNTNQPPKTNSANDLSKLEDLDPIAPARTDTPKVNQFISSADAQQKNPSVQLRQDTNGKSFLTDNQQNPQNGLIDTLDFNTNDEIKINAGSSNNNGATGLTFRTQNSLISKISSKGYAETNLNEGVEGEDKKYEFGKFSLDGKIIELKQSAKEISKEMAAANPLTEMSKIAELQKKLAQVEKDIAKHTAARTKLAQLGLNLANTIAYIKPKDGIVMPEFDGAYILQFEDGTQVVIHDPAAAGWTYQTFATYVEPRQGMEVLRGFQSLGQETKFASIPEKGTATYEGISTAYLVSDGNADRQLSSNVKAIVDFGLKGVRFETSDSQINTVSGNQRVSNAASEYDLKGTATWKDGNLFLGKVTSADGEMSGNLSGKFFGPNAEEIGGTYGLKNTNGSLHFLGGYGAKRK